MSKSHNPLSRTSLSFAGSTSMSSTYMMGSSMPKADTAYQHLIDAPQEVGAGVPERWNLRHDKHYTCCLSDMMLAWKLRDAYEVGFRGFKHQRPTQMHLTCARGAPALTRKVARTDDVYCDMCGNDVAVEKDAKEEFVDPMEMMMRQMQGIKEEEKKVKSYDIVDDDRPFIPGAVQESLGAFYFCRSCKRSSNRFELCAGCHAIEVVQSEGKHHGLELHPHFLRCQHKALTMKR